MARLPVPGSDDGTWGDLLNNFLQVELNTDGTLKTSGTIASKANNTSVVHNTGNESVDGVKTFTSSPIVPTPTSTTDVANKAYVDNTASAGAPDASTTTKGIVQLAGDLTGTATSPAVATGAITGTKIAATTITNANISTSAAIAKSKLASLAIVDADVSAISESKVTNLTTDLAAKAPTSRLITAGTGLTGGGDLSADRTLAVSYGTASGTAAQGNDSRITGAIQSSTATTKGDILVATASATIARLGVGSDGQILTADSTQTSGVKWAPASGGAAAVQNTGVYPLSAYGFFTATAAVESCTQVSTLSGIFFGRVFVPAGKAINGIGTVITTAGTVGAGGENSFAVYTDAGVLVQQTTTTNTLWTTTGWVTQTFGTPIASQGSDRYVYVSAISNGYSAAANTMYAVFGNTAGAAMSGGYGMSATAGRRAFYNGASSWPASFDPTTYGTLSNYLPLIALA
ncbi:MAG TPA: hypothetical protein VLG40_02725 [Candidatus Saccharimonas sp.]|nr:hypothetical protein [Candidatus Saccharimonas sp.]